MNSTWKRAALLAAILGMSSLSACGDDAAGDDPISGGASGAGEAAPVATVAEADVAPVEVDARAGAYTAPADMGLQPGENAYFATIKTTKGDIEVELFPEVAPQHVNSFMFLSEAGFYDGLVFHRVVPGFVIQGGDPTGTGGGGPGYSIPAEFNSENPVPHRVGTLAMARSGDPNSGGSQWYIVLEDSPSATGLNGQYTVFGHVTSGMSVVQQIAQGDGIVEIRTTAKDISERVISPDDLRGGTLPENN